MDIFVVSKIEKYKIIAFGRDFGKINFSDNPGQKEGTTVVYRKALNYYAGRHFFARESCICNEANPPLAREYKGNPPNRSKMTLFSYDTKAELNHCFIIHSN